jgi:hypothetical protein
MKKLISAEISFKAEMNLKSNLKPFLESIKSALVRRLKVKHHSSVLRVSAQYSDYLPLAPHSAKPL